MKQIKKMTPKELSDYRDLLVKVRAEYTYLGKDGQIVFTCDRGSTAIDAVNYLDDYILGKGITVAITEEELKILTNQQ